MKHLLKKAFQFPQHWQWCTVKVEWDFSHQTYKTGKINNWINLNISVMCLHCTTFLLRRWYVECSDQAGNRLVKLRGFWSYYNSSDTVQFNLDPEKAFLGQECLVQFTDCDKWPIRFWWTPRLEARVQKKEHGVFHPVPGDLHWGYLV